MGDAATPAATEATGAPAAAEPGFMAGDLTPFAFLELIDGELREPSIGLGKFLRNPNTQEKLVERRETDSAQIEKALAAAHRVARERTWENLGVDARVDILTKIAAELEKMEGDIGMVDCLNTGVVVSLTKAIGGSLKMVFGAGKDAMGKAEISKTLPGSFGEINVVRRPWGPVVVLAPFNVPAGTVAPKVLAAMVAGCPVLLKASEWAPCSISLLAKAAHLAGCPPGVLQVLHGAGHVGAALVADPRTKSVNFTGSARAGRMVAVACAQQFKPVTLELGGSNPVVVLEDANLAVAIAAVAQSLTVLNGQWCCGVSRVIVHSDLKDMLIQGVLLRLAEMKLGASTDEASEMGPLAFSEHKEVVLEALDRLRSLGGVAHSSTVPDSAFPNGNFVPPTLVTGVKPEDCIPDIFGPIASVLTFETDAEAAQLANMALGMLVCNVITRDEKRGFAFGKMVESGLVMINGVGFGFESPTGDPTFSFWGEAGSGIDGSLETMVQNFCGLQVVGMNGAPPPKVPFKPSAADFPFDFRHRFYTKIRLR